jgi:membrane fusion protein (multidrug efflux system)
MVRISPALAILVGLCSFSLTGCQPHGEEESHEAHHKVVITSPKVQSVVLTQRYVCQIHSRRHIDVKALQSGYLQPISIKEGQEVKEDQVMFTILPILYKSKLDAEVAEAELAKLEYQNTKRLSDQNVVSKRELALYEAKWKRAKAKAELAKAELGFTEVKASFDGIIDRLRQQQGSLIKEGEILTTLSDNKVMWVYFNVPEARYLEYMAGVSEGKEPQQVELELANHTKFKYPGKIAAIEAQFNNENGNIPFRADFPNPNLLLRHGMTGTILLHRTLENAIVIPQRATFETLAQRYVYVVDKDGVAHQRLIKVAHELPDIYVIESGLRPDEKFVYEGVQQVHDKAPVEEPSFRRPDEVLAHLKYHAE